MNIFEYEINDGLEQKIKTSASVGYASAVQPSMSLNKNKIKNIKSLASADDADLYYVQSILVSSSWNKNDDIFDKAEIWQARNTPEDKPTNLEHDEHTIIGHIVSNWPITDEGQIISESTDVNDLPEKYHILTGSVIYKAYSVPELQQRANKLIAEIEEGNKYVSMECLFGNFDYGLVNRSTGEYKILSRNEESSYLTKYLRAYGGQGEYDNYKIGRVLRNITFSGKGFVDKPANPDSVIFTKNMITQASEKKLNEKIGDLSNTGVSNNQLNPNVETITMSSEITEATITTTPEETTMEPSTETTETVVIADVAQEPVVVADVAQETVSELESLRQEKEAAAQMHEEAMMNQTAENQKMKKDLEDLKKVVESYMAKEAEMQKNTMMNQRKASLVELGVENETAEAAVQKLEHLDDNTFAVMTSLFASSFEAFAKKKNKKEESKDEATQNEVAAKVEEETKDEEKNEDEKKESPKNAELGKKSKSSVSVEILETAEVDNSVNLSIGGSVESAVESTRAALVEFISNRLGKTL